MPNFIAAHRAKGKAPGCVWKELSEGRWVVDWSRASAKRLRGRNCTTIFDRFNKCRDDDRIKIFPCHSPIWRERFRASCFQSRKMAAISSTSNCNSQPWIFSGLPRDFLSVTLKFPQRYPSFDGLKSARHGYGMGMIASHFWRLVHSIYRGPLLSNSCCKNQHISSRFSYIEETFGSKVGGVTPRFPRRYPEISTGLPRIFHGVTPKFPRRTAEFSTAPARKTPRPGGFCELATEATSQI